MRRATTTLRQSVRIAIPALLGLIGLQGCASLGCDDYVTYDENLDSWVGAALTDYEQRRGSRPLRVMERPQNRLEYEYDTPYRSYDGTTDYCRTYLDVDRASGEIVGWRYEGECYLHGYCAG